MTRICNKIFLHKAAGLPPGCRLQAPSRVRTETPEQEQLLPLWPMWFQPLRTLLALFCVLGEGTQASPTFVLELVTAGHWEHRPAGGISQLPSSPSANLAPRTGAPGVEVSRGQRRGL